MTTTGKNELLKHAKTSSKVNMNRNLSKSANKSFKSGNNANIYFKRI